MKRYIITLLFFLIPVFLYCATLEEMIEQAKAKRSAGSFEEAVDILNLATAAHSGSAAAKQTIADAYTDFGIKEYNNRNYKNAFECFRTAIKLAPTNQVASQYFWKMKKDLDVNNLKNEGSAAAAPFKKTLPAQVEVTEKVPVPEAQQQVVESVASKEALEKLKKTEVELEAIRKSTLTAQNENALLKAELEQQKKRAEEELAAIREATRTARNDGTLLRTELEQQKRRAEEEGKAIRESAFTAKTENVQLKSELEQQKQVIEQLRDNVQKTGQNARQENKSLTDMLAVYKSLLEKENDKRETEANYIVEKLNEQKVVLEKQGSFNVNFAFIVAGGLVILTLVLFFLLFMIMRARARRRFEMQRMSPSYGADALTSQASGAQALPQQQSLPGSFLLDFYPSSGRTSETQVATGDEAMYRDLLRAERLKKMYDQMKSGTLNWNTVRDYIDELEKELRVEILKIVETKLFENDLFSPQAVLPIIFPFLTDSDDYLREKAESLAKRALIPVPAQESAPQSALIEVRTSASNLTEDSPLGLKRLLEIPDQLRIVLKGRDSSVSTAKIARGIAHLLGLSGEDTELLYKAALAHDAGYLVLDRNRLQRIISKTAISEEDFKFIQTHTKKGPKYFAGIKLPEPIKDAILYHHERNDGSGYPEGLKGSDIPLFAKIICVAETFSALVNERPYRERLTPEAALAVIKDGIKIKYDREHIDALVDFVRRTGGIR